MSQGQLPVALLAEGKTNCFVNLKRLAGHIEPLIVAHRY
jgi:hypothetical protein